MGRGDDSNDLYGGLYSPSQSLVLASQRGQELLASPPPNPLNTPSSPTSIAPTGQPESSVNTNAFNPLLQPAFPIASMSPERQQRWMEVTQQAQTNQAAIDKAAMDAEIARREEAHKLEIIKQSREMIDRSTELDPSNLKDYPLARAKLARDFPLGAGSLEVQRALTPLDEIHKQASGYETWYNKEEEKLRNTQDQDRLKEARKTASDLGPDYLARFAQTQKDKGVEAAIDEVNTTSGKAKQADVVAQLKSAGLSEEQIQAKYGGGTTGEPFRFGAAEFEAKQKVSPEADYNRSLANLLSLKKDRDAAVLAGWDPSTGEPVGGWNDQMEAVWQGVTADVNRLSARRPGVVGFDPAKAKADREAKAKADAEAAAAKAKEEQAKAGQPGYFGNIANAIMGYPAPGAIPSATPASTPKPAATPIPGVDYSTLRIDRTTGKKYAVGNKTKASPKGEWVEVQ